MEFRLLGPLEVRVDGRPLALGGLRQRRVLAALLLNANSVVALPRLIEAAWDEDPPATAHRQVRNRVGALRAVLARAGRFIDTEGGGYRLRVGPDELDLLVFEELVRRGRADRDAAILRQALGLWRGPALAELAGALVHRGAAVLDEQRLAVWEECLELELAAGGHARVVTELGALVAEHPLRERPVGLLMMALYRCGRQAEGLSVYRELAARLVEELGIDPAPELSRLHESMLRADPALTPPSSATPAGPAAPVVPAQLPGDVWGFTGRVNDLVRLDQLLSDGQAGRAVVISAIGGTAGIGKTALAVHWAHRVRDKFPDGQLYVNLRGFDPTGSMVTPSDALRGFLEALHVPPSRIPSSLDTQAALYRSLLADRRMLVVLDNAGDAKQVRALLPGAPGCLVVITSRSQLTGLVAAEGAHPTTLDLLTEDEARQLLAARIGAGRVAAEPGSVDEIITGCARLPLALTIVAARAATHPGFPLATLADELRRARGGLDAFAGEDPAADVRAVLSCSYRALSSDAARLFRLLALHPGPDLADPAAASLAGVPMARVRPLLAELTRAHLITEQTPGRYSFHDLLRAYAGEHAHTVDAPADRLAAAHRLLDHYLHTAHTAALLLAPLRDPITLDPPRAGVTGADLTDFESAMAWLATEHPVLLAAIRQAGGSGFDSHTWRLAWTLLTFLSRRGHWHDWVATHTAALAAARRLAHREGQAHTHHGLAVAYTRLGRLDDAQTHFRRALDLFGELGHRIGQADTHQGLVLACEQQGRHEQALHHAQAALELFRTTAHRAAQAQALNAVGWCHAQLGDHQQALERCRQALTLLEELGDRHGQATTWDSLGYAHHRLGDHHQATTCYRHALGLYRDLGDRYNEADVVTDLGDTHHSAGNLDQARDAWRQALAILDELRHPDADTVRAKLNSLD